MQIHAHAAFIFFSFSLSLRSLFREKLFLADAQRRAKSSAQHKKNIYKFAHSLHIVYI